jgi:hypothetical protein
MSCGQGATIQLLLLPAPKAGMAASRTILGTQEGRALMWRLYALIVFALLLPGCASEGPHWYDEALKDARGDNQKMRGFGPATDSLNK